MFIRHLLGLSLLLISLSLPLTLAQTPAQPDTRTPQPGVNIIINSKLVRFAAQAELSEWRLEVLNQRGESVFDSGLVSSPTLDWPLYNKQGEAVESGLYAYTLTLKLPNSDSQRTQRGHIILDRAGSSSDQIWVTSSNETGIGGDSGASQLTVTGSSESIIGGARVTTENERPALQRTSDGRILEEQGRNDQADTQPKAPNAPNIAGTGTTGRLSKWLNGPSGILGDSVVSESNGKIGIGTTGPEQILHANGPNEILSTGPGAGFKFRNRGSVTSADDWVWYSSGNVARFWRSGVGDVLGITTNGNFGIGTSNPGAQLHLSRSAPAGQPIAQIEVTRSIEHRFGYSYFTDFSMRDGNVGIGTTASAYKLHIGVADQGLRVEGPSGGGAAVSVGGNGDFSIDAPGVVGGRFVVKNGGNVGIGTASPSGRLHIAGSAELDGTLLFQPHPSKGSYQSHVHWGSTGDWYIRSASGTGKVIIQDAGGNVGIGTASPSGRLHIAGSAELDGTLLFQPHPSKGSYQSHVHWGSTGDWYIRSASGTGKVIIQDAGGNVGIGTLNPTAKLDVAGTTRTGVLEITGGADFSERFDVKAASDSDSDESPRQVQPGMVVSIDQDNPGKLVISSQVYDRRVAGIISGAGGVNPGMLMGQAGSVADGSQPVALTGRVYCWADASNGPIEPGDLLTTSNTPGHATKVTDWAKAQGAIIGKAMTGLKEGKGLVLVLVTLQ